MRRAIPREILRSSSWASGRKIVRYSLTARQGLPHHVLDRDARCGIRHPFVDDAIDLTLFPLLVLAENVDRDDGGDFPPSPGDHCRLVVAVGALDDLGQMRTDVTDRFDGHLCHPSTVPSVPGVHNGEGTAGELRDGLIAERASLPRAGWIAGSKRRHEGGLG